jgi:hypothetical protein
MNFNTIDAIRQSGFEGFVTILALQKSRCCEVPTKPGVYLILRSNTAPPDFLSESVGGHFKGKNPTVAVGELERKWVEDAVVLNIGKAGRPGNATLRSRLTQYMQFGQGEKEKQWGITAEDSAATSRPDLAREEYDFSSGRSWRCAVYPNATT